MQKLRVQNLNMYSSNFIELLFVFVFPSYLHCHRGSVHNNIIFFRRNPRSCSAVCKMLHWKNSYTLPAFPYDVKILLAEKKCPDHSMRIRIIECLQADMTKYLAGSL